MDRPRSRAWTSRGRNTILEEPRSVRVLHNGAWYPGDLTATRYEPATGWWGFCPVHRRRRDDALALEAHERVEEFSPPGLQWLIGRSSYLRAMTPTEAARP
jgi:hypothetical protein